MGNICSVLFKFLTRKIILLSDQLSMNDVIKFILALYTQSSSRLFIIVLISGGKIVFCISGIFQLLLLSNAVFPPCFQGFQKLLELWIAAFSITAP